MKSFTLTVLSHCHCRLEELAQLPMLVQLHQQENYVPMIERATRKEVRRTTLRLAVSSNGRHHTFAEVK